MFNRTSGTSKRIAPVFFLVLILLFTGCASTADTIKTRDYRDTWFGTDKLYHLATSGVAAAAATKIAVNNKASPCDAVWIGISTAIIVGSGKEWYDVKVKKTLFSWKDMVWNFAGGILGSFAVSDCR